MPDMVNANSEVPDEPMIDAADSVSSEADIKLEPGISGSIQLQIPRTGDVLPQDAFESTFQVTVPQPKQGNLQYQDLGYEIQLMLLEQQNKKRLIISKQEQATKELPQQEGGDPNPSVQPQRTEPSIPQSTFESSSHITGPPPQKKVEEMTPREKIDHFEAEHKTIAQRSKQLREVIKTGDQSKNYYNMQLMLFESQGKMRLARDNKERALKELRESSGNPNSSVPHYQRSMLDHHNQRKAALEQAEGQRQQNVKPSPCDCSVNWEEHPVQIHNAYAPSSITTQAQQAPMLLRQQEQIQKAQETQRPQFPLDWEAQAKSHLGFAPNATINPADQIKLDAIMKQKYEQVWGSQEKQGNGQNDAAPPVIKTYQEQLRAQALMKQKQQMAQQAQAQGLIRQQQAAQQAQMMAAHTYQMSQVRAGNQSGMTNQEKATARFPNNPVARQDYQVQLNLLEEQNRKQLAAAAQSEQSSTGEMQLQDYQMQIMLLEQQNKKRIMMAREEQEYMQPNRKKVMVAPAGQSQKCCG
jgi:predicted transposase YbfD/YdcC